ncbi:hypothetical protein KOAAANKH_00198 [Brevundimonas sp. NIBR10]|uniref:DUF2306 domain-containing protein n=1 Tax=Brevundimonas sp. NIBR10 TaxID=3015997 RepID=UPI0022F1C68B|nr:DUF2306 domain-containing protein [Brevundimonas sp. NIBR10]WGM45336.1 hypothetical protein KOAAANKH_00198 [Brevundimonas sp. NIBR10]
MSSITRPLLRPWPLAGIGLILVVAAWVALAQAGLLPLWSHPHAPDLALLAAQPVVIQLHVGAALSALLIGTVLLLGVKGNTLHRTLGWSWVIAMATVAISSFFIRTSGTFSWIHLLSGWTVIALPMAVFAARRHDIKSHRRGMTGLFVGGLLIAGLFTFAPGRLMWKIVFG